MAERTVECVVAEPDRRSSSSAKRHRRVVFVRGIVQGVGFRPFVFGLATRLELGGFVQNRPDGVLVEIEGERDRIQSFLERLRSDAPALALLDEVQVEEISPRGDLSFAIARSEGSGGAASRFFSPDVGTCHACLAELTNPTDRRYRYPFINCTACGPRLTIIRRAPYDREHTTMVTFEMCADCRAEYEDPTDRRYHAQPIACHACGPELVARDAGGLRLDVDPWAFCRQLLLSDRIIAVKGIGGFHLACDATSDAAAQRLRRRKHRDEKPFAVMVPDLEAARRLCHVSAAEAELLSSSRKPIVLLRRRERGEIARAIAPNNPLLGLMLPYSPVHHLLAREAGRPLALTSGNRSDEPIAFEDDDAFERLHGIADGYLTHDRPIHTRCDDSVARVVGGRATVLRRSRGYAPEPIRLAGRCSQRILALGGHLKSTFAMGRGDHAILSHHLGDLGEWSALRSFREAVAQYESLFAFQPDLVAHDLHPGYATTEYARERRDLLELRVQLVAVQHHHAHMASCMLENDLCGPTIGVTFDGAGYGSDGTLWGGEILVGDYRSVRRAAHLRAVRLPGGEKAMRQPWRMAVAHGIDCGEDPAHLVTGLRPDAIAVIRKMIETGFGSPLTTSVGRLFDAVAALVGLRTTVTFEGQAAMELEWLASTAGADDAPALPFALEPGLDGMVIDTRPLVRAVIGAVRSGAPAPSIALRFHKSLAEIVTQVTARLRDETGIEQVVLTGGVFQNGLLLQMATEQLEALGLRVLSHSRVPANDGGLALGQLAVAAATAKGDP